MLEGILICGKLKEFPSTEAPTAKIIMRIVKIGITLFIKNLLFSKIGSFDHFGFD